MKSLTKKLVFGLLATTLTTCGSRAVMAGPPPWHPHPNPWIHPYPWGHHHYPMPIVRPVYRPVIIENVSPSYEPDATNPAPLAEIRLVNPRENRVTLKYRLDDGQIQYLRAGYSVEIHQAVTIEFNRGGSAGLTRYNLSDGTYKFVSAGRMWDLVLQAQTSEGTVEVADAAANPVPGN